MSISLPDGFTSLQDLVDEWVLPTERARMEKRFGSSMDELKAFYDRMVPQLPGILSHLSKIKPNEMSPNDKLLLDLTLSLADVSIAVEKVKAPRSPSTYEGERLEFLHETA